MRGLVLNAEFWEGMERWGCAEVVGDDGGAGVVGRWWGGMVG